MAQDREIVEEAYAGDVIGVFDPGIFAIGDTLCDASYKFEFKKSQLSLQNTLLVLRKKIQ